VFGSTRPERNTLLSPRGRLQRRDLILVACSQLLYLLFALAWLFRWMHFYPGNPIQTAAILCGLSFSIAAACTSSVGRYPYSFITIIVAVVTAGMWLLAALGSAA
jgi:hypothetical protein